MSANSEPLTVRVVWRDLKQNLVSLIGTDWVEIDVQESKDGVVVVAHDSDLKKSRGRRRQNLGSDRRQTATNRHWVLF